MSNTATEPDHMPEQKDTEAAAADAAAHSHAQPSDPAPGSDQADLATIQADLEKFRDLALRSQADFDNYRKRAAREREDALRFANENLLRDLLPVLDNFELGLNAACEQDPNSAIVQGMTMVQKQLAEFLNSQGVATINAARGTAFDPSIHEALGQEQNADLPEGHVIRQIRKGYKLRDRLLRAASVFVSRGQSGDPA